MDEGYERKKEGIIILNMVFDAMTAGSLRMTIDPDTNRNHCPYCLTSLHLDVAPGDRAADCGGRMEAVAVWVRRDGEWALIHRCARCGALSSNRIAADDNPLLLMSLALHPLAEPPFPIARMRELTEALQK